VQVHRGVDIPVFRMTTTATDKYTVFQGQFIVERPTYPAHLAGGEPAIRDNDVGPIRLSLLHEHLPKAPKTSITDGARELVILHHPFDVQIFNDDLLVGGRKPGRQLVERIVANRRNPCVETSKLRLRPVPMRRPFDAACQLPIDTPQMVQCGLQWLGAFNLFPGGQRGEMLHPEIDPSGAEAVRNRHQVLAHLTGYQL
jgi:hypothetical protein